MSRAQVIEGAAPEVQEELDRVWMALDGLTRQVEDLEQREARSSRVRSVIGPQDTQHGPTPDYRIAGAAPVEGPCGCEEAVALRAEIAELRRKFAGDVATFRRAEANIACIAEARELLNQANAPTREWTRRYFRWSDSNPESPAKPHAAVCDECLAIHGPSNENTLCPRSSNHRG